jgi:hypothetical protein
MKGDMFAGVPGGADAYLIKNVLMDRSDDEAVTVLRHCRQAMSQLGRLVVIDPVIWPGEQSAPSTLLDLVMLLSTGCGRCRMQAEFQALFAAAGSPSRRLSRHPRPCP